MLVAGEPAVSSDLERRIARLGYAVLATAATVATALDLAEARPPDLVLMDFGLRAEVGLDGAEVFRSRWEIPVVFVVGEADLEAVRADTHALPFGYLRQPLHDGDIRAAVEMALRLARSEKKLEQISHNLNERVKELSCLYGITALVEKRDNSLADIIQGTVDLLPAALQYPDLAVARAVLCGQIYQTRRYAETPWRQTSAITSDGLGLGVLEVAYLEQLPAADEGPFLEEERSLVAAVAERMGRIVERVRAERQYETVVRTALDGFWLVDLDGRFLDVNDAYCNLTGYCRTELLAMRVADVEARQTAPETVQHLQQVVAEGSDRFETRHRCQDGRIVDVEVSARYLDAEEGRIYVFLRDITERKQAAAELARHRDHLEEQVRERTAALRESKKFADAVENAIPGTFYVWTEEGELIRWNKTYEERYGYSGDELRTMSVDDWFDGEDLQRAVDTFKLCFDKGESSCEAVAIAKDGRRIPSFFTARRLEIDGQRYLVGFGLDITERNRAQQQLLASREDLRRLATELSMVEDRERRGFASYLHDQIGQELAVLRMRVDELAVTVDPEQIAQAVVSIRDLIDRTISDTRNLTFDLSPPILYELGLVPAVEWIGERISDQHGLAFSFVDDGQTKVVSLDLGPLLFRAVRELLLNVVKHGHATRVELTISRRDDMVRIVVADNGVGFDTSQLVAQGTSRGFGLYSIRERIAVLGGSLTMNSAPGTGTRATLVAPLQLTEAVS